MGLLDGLFGSGPSTKVKTLATPGDVEKSFQALLPLIAGNLEALMQNSLGQTAAFGPAFQGGQSQTVANTALNQALLPLLAQVMGFELNRRAVITDPGSPGILPALAAGAGAGLGGGLGAMLLGSVGGGTPPITGSTSGPISNGGLLPRIMGV